MVTMCNQPTGSQTLRATGSVRLFAVTQPSGTAVMLITDEEKSTASADQVVLPDDLIVSDQRQKQKVRVGP